MKPGGLFKPLLALAALQLFFLLAFAPVREPDSVSFLAAAERLQQTGSFSDNTRLPGYPAFLAASRLLFGPSDLPVIAAQHALGLLLFFLLARRLQAARERYIFAALFGLDLLYSSYQHAVMSDFQFSLLLCLSALAAGRGGGALRAADGLLAGFFTALALLTKPAIMYFPLFVLPLLLLTPAPARARMRFAAAYLLPVLAAGNLWCWHNYRVSGSYALLPMGSYHYVGRVMGHMEFPENSVTKKYFIEQLASGPGRDERPRATALAVAAMTKDGLDTAVMDAEFKEIVKLSVLRRPFAFLGSALKELAYFFTSAHNLYAKHGLKDRLPVSVSEALRDGDLGGVFLKLAVSLHPFYWAVSALFLGFAAANWRRLAAGGDFFFLYSAGLVLYIALISAFANYGLARYRGAVHPLMLYFCAVALARLLPGKEPSR